MPRRYSPRWNTRLSRHSIPAGPNGLGLKSSRPHRNASMSFAPSVLPPFTARLNRSQWEAEKRRPSWKAEDQLRYTRQLIATLAGLLAAVFLVILACHTDRGISTDI